MISITWFHSGTVMRHVSRPEELIRYANSLETTNEAFIYTNGKRTSIMYKTTLELIKKVNRWLVLEGL